MVTKHNSIQEQAVKKGFGDRSTQYMDRLIEHFIPIKQAEQNHHHQPHLPPMKKGKSGKYYIQRKKGRKYCEKSIFILIQNSCQYQLSVEFIFKG